MNPETPDLHKCAVRGCDTRAVSPEDHANARLIAAAELVAAANRPLAGGDVRAHAENLNEGSLL